MGGGFSGGLGDLFDAFFGGNPFGGDVTGSERAPAAGADLEVVLDLSFEEAVFGTQAPVTVRTAVPCDDCQATGRGARHAARRPAPTAVVPARCGGCASRCSARSSTASPCSRCGGMGTFDASPCPTCRW